MSETTQNLEATSSKRPTLAVVLSLVAVVLSAAALIVSLTLVGEIQQRERETRVDECERYGIGTTEYFLCAEEAQ